MRPLICGIDIGGTKVAVGVADPGGNLLVKKTLEGHGALPEEEVLAMAADLAKAALSEAGASERDIPGIGVGMAGHVRFKEGVMITTSNLKGFKNYPIREELRKHFPSLPVLVDNDANCQALGEYLFGAGRGHDDMIFITVSTGIGAGLILNRRLYRGITGTAGEIGHAIVEPSSTIRCTCGNYGCFMAHASTLALNEVVRQRIEAGQPTDLPWGASCSISGRDIHRHALNGDRLANDVILKYADYLGILLYNVFQVFNPPLVVLGGGLMSWECGYFERIKDRFRELAGDMLHDPMEIVKSAIGPEVAILGAAVLPVAEGER